jgi:hypothetical protein
MKKGRKKERKEARKKERKEGGKEERKKVRKEERKEERKEGRKKERKKIRPKKTIFHNIQQNMKLELENLPSILTFHFPLPSLMVFQPHYIHFTHLIKKTSDTSRHCEMLETTEVLSLKAFHTKQKSSYLFLKLYTYLQELI